MARTKYHIVPSGDDWAVKKQGAARASSLHATKEDAIVAGRTLALANQPSQLIVHGRDGKIQNEWTYGNDPFPPRG